MITLSLFWSCRHDIDTQEKKAERSIFFMHKKYSDFQDNKILMDKISKVRKSLTINNSSKNGDETYNIKLSDALYIGDSINNRHSYIFTLPNENGSFDLRNLVLAYQSTGNYDAYLATYTLTQAERELIDSGVNVDVHNKTKIIAVDNANVQITAHNTGTCYEINQHEEDCVCHDVHEAGGCTHPDQIWVIIEYPCTTGGGSGGSGSGTPVPGGGSGGGSNGGSESASNPNDGVLITPSGGNVKNNPCTKTKALLQKPEVQANIQELKIQSTVTGDSAKEIGFKIGVDGIPSAIIQGGKANVKLNPSVGDLSGYHNHPPDGIKIHSTEDIIGVMSFAIYNPDNYKDSFLGMIGSTVCSTCNGGYYYYHYLIRYTGSYAEIHTLLNLTNWDHETLGDEYRQRQRELRTTPAYTDNQLETISNKGLEKLFFETLKKMGLENKISLQRVDDNGTNQIVNNITLDENNEPMAIPCP